MCADSSSADVSLEDELRALAPKKQTSAQKVRAEIAQRRQEEFDAVLADGSMRIRYMTQHERRYGVKVRMKPKRQPPPQSSGPAFPESLLRRSSKAKKPGR